MTCCQPPHREASAVMCLRRYLEDNDREGREAIVRWLDAELPEPWARAVWVDADREGTVLVGAHTRKPTLWRVNGEEDLICVRLRLPVRTPPPWLHPDWCDNPHSDA